MADRITIEDVLAGKRKIAKPKPGKSLQERFPEAAKDWCQQRNGNITPSDISGSSAVWAWWTCRKCHHDYDMQIIAKTHKTSQDCPYCDGHRFDPKINSLLAVYPTLADEWATDNDFLPSDVSFRSYEVVRWHCPDCSHEWNRSISKRIHGSGCPKCGHKLPPLSDDYFFHPKKPHKHLTKDERLLCNHNPELLAEWDYEENARNNIYPDKITYGSDKKVSWICSKGHRFLSPILQRTTKGGGCPYCSRSKVLPGETDLATTHPKIAAELNEKLSGFSASEVLSGSPRYAWWNCSNNENHPAYKQRISERTGPHSSICPICAKVGSDRGARMPRSGITLAESGNEKLIREWDPDNELSIDEIAACSNFKVKWICEVCGHHWTASVNNRMHGSGCPKCNYEKGTSFAEQALLYYVRRAFPKDSIEGNYSVEDEEQKIPNIDIAIANRKIALEHDGCFWHNDRQERDDRKEKQLTEIGWAVFRLKEIPVGELIPQDTDTIIYYEHCKSWTDTKYQSIGSAIERMLRLLGSDYDEIDVIRDKNDIYEQFKSDKAEKSVAANYPHLIEEWSEKNLPLTLWNFTRGSNYRAWWKCSKGHEWQTSISNRTGNGTGCPKCAHIQDPTTGRWIKTRKD